jgi:sigma-B regulation protein RsbU (phosphoserine phosphatase)
VDDTVEQVPAPTLGQLYDEAPCGYMTTTMDGTVAHVNARVLEWTGFARDEVVGRRRFTDLLRVGARIFFESQVAPTLQLQGHVHDVALELLGADGRTTSVVATAVVVPAEGAVPAHVHLTLVDGQPRREFERSQVEARLRAEESESRTSEVARTLQRSLLQGVTESGPGYTVTIRYRPAVETLEIGGDWYDAFPVGDGRVAISVGDVIGRGLTAAVAMGQIRSALRALAAAGDGPSQVLDHLDRFVPRVVGAWMATTAIVEVDPATGEARYASAGHLPALVVEPDGFTRFLWEGRSPPLAALALDAPRPSATTTVPPGSRILLCTDGLVERAGRDINVGLEAWADSAAGLHLTAPEVMADMMLKDLLADEVDRDDVCLVCLDLDPDAT